MLRRLPLWVKILMVATVVTAVAAASVVPAVYFSQNGQYLFGFFY